MIERRIDNLGDAILRMNEAVSAGIAHASRAREYADIAGEEDDSFQLLEDQLQSALVEVRSVRHHQHEWNEDDYCDICGADGRA